MNKVTFGLRNLHVAFIEDGQYGKPIRIPGVVSWTPSATGDSSPFYADDITYYNAQSNNGYEGDLTVALIPDEVLAQMMGWDYDEEKGVLIEVADGQPKEFAMLFEVQGDQRKRRTVYYRCQASRPAKEEQTKGESTEVNPEQLTVIVSPTEMNGKTIVKATIEENDSNTSEFESFFESVYGMTPEI